MYALYSKNKPQSDALLSSHGNEFFKVRLETNTVPRNTCSFVIVGRTKPFKCSRVVFYEQGQHLLNH